VITEKDMEDQIAAHPERFLGERQLTLVSRQLRIGPYRFDLLFSDRHGGKLIVEIQRGTLDREHTYKILDYYDEYRERNPGEFIDVMVIANVIPAERKKRLQSLGVEYREVSEQQFQAEAAVECQSEQCHSDSIDVVAPTISEDGEKAGYSFQSLGPSRFILATRNAIERALCSHNCSERWKIGGESSLTVLSIPVTGLIGGGLRVQIWMERPKGGTVACKFEIAAGSDSNGRERIASSIRNHLVRRGLPNGVTESSGSTIVRRKLHVPAIINSPDDDTDDRAAIYSSEIEKIVEFLQFLDIALVDWKPPE